jgi:hypothetical protein
LFNDWFIYWFPHFVATRRVCSVIVDNGLFMHQYDMIIRGWRSLLLNYFVRWFNHITVWFHARCMICWSEAFWASGKRFQN